MSFTDINMYVVIALTMLVGIGITIFFVGSLITVASAFGEKKTYWGIALIICLPLSVLYCLLNRNSTSYQQKYLGAGLIMLSVAFLILLSLQLV